MCEARGTSSIPPPSPRHLPIAGGSGLGAGPLKLHSSMCPCRALPVGAMNATPAPRPGSPSFLSGNQMHSALESAHLLPQEAHPDCLSPPSQCLPGTSVPSPHAHCPCLVGWGCPEAKAGADTHSMCGWSGPSSQCTRPARHRAQHTAPGRSTPRPSRSRGTGQTHSLGRMALGRSWSGTARRPCGTEMHRSWDSFGPGLLGTEHSPTFPRSEVTEPPRVLSDPSLGTICVCQGGCPAAAWLFLSQTLHWTTPLACKRGCCPVMTDGQTHSVLGGRASEADPPGQPSLRPAPGLPPVMTLQAHFFPPAPKG